MVDTTMNVDGLIMSIVDEAVKADIDPPARPETSPRVSKLGLWLRVGLVCLLLGGSGVVRAWQARRLATVLQDGRRSPFPLESLPINLGTWKGEEATLDPLIVRVSGATDIVTRRYVDQKTGAALEAIILYGPSAEVFLHRPEVCYPNAGFKQLGDGETRLINVGTSEVPFRSLVYTKGEGGRAALQEVHYSWRYHGRWSPELVKHKEFERIPGMFKIHLARTLTPRERRDLDNPNEEFLKVLIPELERRLTESVSQASPRARSAKGVVR